jgi:SAM-dependent methyltransferase
VNVATAAQRPWRGAPPGEPATSRAAVSHLRGELQGETGGRRHDQAGADLSAPEASARRSGGRADIGRKSPGRGAGAFLAPEATPPLSDEPKKVRMRRHLLKFYWLARRIIVPRLRFSQDLYERVLQDTVKPDTVWLDLGCGRRVLPRWRAHEEIALVTSCKAVVGMDYDLHSLKDHHSIALKVKGDITGLPFRDRYFDLVTANMVVEHLDDPLKQFAEISRVLKPGGIFVFHTPNILGYPTIGNRLVPEKLKVRLIYTLDGRNEHDIFATHYKANSRRQIRELARASGLEVLQIKMITTDAVFAVVPLLVIPELLLIKLLMTKPLRALRTNIIASLRKKPALHQTL